MNALEPEVVRERAEVTGVGGNRQMPGRNGVTVTCPPNPDHPESVERPGLTHRQKPVAEDPRMDEEHGLAGAPVGIANVHVLEREAVHATDSTPETRARAAV